MYRSRSRCSASISRLIATQRVHFLALCQCPLWCRVYRPAVEPVPRPHSVRLPDAPRAAPRWGWGAALASSLTSMQCLLSTTWMMQQSVRRLNSVFGHGGSGLACRLHTQSEGHAHTCPSLRKRVCVALRVVFFAFRFRPGRVLLIRY